MKLGFEPSISEDVVKYIVTFYTEAADVVSVITTKEYTVTELESSYDSDLNAFVLDLDNIKELKVIDAEVKISVAAVDEADNKSDAISTSVNIDFLAPVAPGRVFIIK